MQLKEILEILKNFLTPSTKINQTTVSNLTIIDILNQIIENLKSNHESYYNDLINELNLNDENDILWKICQITLKILVDLNNCEFEKNENNCYLSIADDRLVTIACEFVCCFGIHYNLEDNIGIPIEKLSRFGLIVKQRREHVNIKERNERLNKFFQKLYEIKLNKREHVDIISVFYIKHLHDIICGLIQLAYSPNKCSNDVYLKWLENDLFNEINGSTLVKNLMMTQGVEKYIKSPAWFTNCTSNLLTKCVLCPNSVINVIKAILDEIDINKTTESANDWKKCDLIARILTKCPRSLTNEEYIKFIAPQVIGLFHSIDETKPTKHLIRVAGSIYSLFAQKLPDLTKIYLTKQLILPFNFENKIENLINADDLFKSLKLIHLIYCTSTDPNWLTLKQLDEKFMHLIFQIYLVSSTKQTCRKTTRFCEDLLKIYLNYYEDSTQKQNQIDFLNRLLECSILNSQQTCSYCSSSKVLIDCENLVACDRIFIKPVDDNDEEGNAGPTLKQVEARCNAIVNLIKKLNDKTIEIDYLFHLFTKLNSYITQQINSNVEALGRKDQLNQQTDSTLLQFEKNISKIEKEFNIKILYLTQISIYLENLDSDLLIKNYLKLINLCKLILENIVNLINLNEENIIITEQIIQNEQEICNIILNILSLFTSEFIECSYEVKKELVSLLPCLEKIKEIYVNHGDLYNLADMLRISIATYGAVKTETTTSTNKTKKLIEEISINEDLNENNNNEGEMNFKPNSFEQVLYELKDPLLPTRGHALILLRQLIEKNDSECLKNLDKIYEIIIDNLKSTDSYIYLAAINCLIAYSSRLSSTSNASKNVLKILLDEFYKNNLKLNENDRLKLGEVIMRLIRNLNELVPFYGDKLIHVFLLGCKSDNEFIRASSLSNLGETCKLLNYKLDFNLNEILICIVSILESDKSVNVKRSAMLVLKLLFEGLSKENFMNTIGDSLLKLYRLLKRILSDIQQDDVIKLHAQLAYEYLDELMRNYLFPKQNLVKEIKVLNP